MKKRITINRHIIASNKKNSESKAPISVKTYKSNDYGSKIKILDDDGSTIAEIIYDPDKPLHCGATAWIETSKEVVVSD